MNRKEQNIAIFEDSMDWIEHKPAGSHSRAPITVTSQRTFKRRAQNDCRTHQSGISPAYPFQQAASGAFPQCPA